MSQLYDTAKKAYWRVRGLGVQPPPSVPARGYTGRIQSIAFLSDGGRLIGGSDDGSVRAWKAESRNGTPTKMTDGGAVYAVAASSDGRRIATAGAKKIITIWDATTYEKVVELTGHSSEVTEVRSLAFSPDSARVVSGLDGGRVFVWSTTTSKPLAQLQGGGHIGLVSSVCFSPSGEEIASCDMQDIRLWQSHSGELGIQPIQSVKAHSLVWPSNDKRLIAGCNDGSIKIFDASTGSLLAQWKGHTAIVHSIAVSHDGKWLASGSGDKTVRLWYTHTRQQIGRGLRHNSEVYSVVISPDGRHLASGGDNNKVSIWAPPASLLENTPTTSNSAPGNVHDEELHPQQVLDPPKEVQMSQSPKDDHNDENMAGKDESEGLATVLQRRSSESSSLRDFLDRSAVPPSIGGAEGPSDQVYSNFFKTDSLDAPPPVDEPPKRRFSKFLNRFSRKKTQRGAETKTQPEPQQAEANSPTDPLPTTTSKRLIEKDKGKQKESIQESTPADDNDRDSAPTPEPRPAASPPHTKRHVRNRATRIRRAMMRRERQKHAYIAELRDRPIYAWDTRPAPDEIERGCCFHLASYICYGQRDPNINPGANNAQPTTQPIPSAHGVAQTNLRSLGARLGRLLVRLHLRKLPPASASAALSAIVPPIPSPHADPSGASAPASIPLPTQPTPTSTITSPTNIPEAPVHASTSPISSSQTPSPPPPAILRPASVEPNIDAGGVPSEMEPNPWQFTDTERVDLVSVEYMVQLDPWHNA